MFKLRDYVAFPEAQRLQPCFYQKLFKPQSGRGTRQVS